MAQSNSGNGKGESKNEALQKLLNAHRSLPPPVYLIPASELGSYRATDNDLLKKLQVVNTAKFNLTGILSNFVVLSKTTLMFDNCRVNAYGKYEIRCVEMAGNLRSLKASAEEIEKLAWFSISTSNVDQQNFLQDQALLCLDSKSKCLFYVKLLEFFYGKNNLTSPNMSTLDPVFGKYQYATPSKEKAAATVSIDGVVVGPPPTKKSRKSTSSEKSSSPVTEDKTSPKDVISTAVISDDGDHDVVQ